MSKGTLFWLFSNGDLVWQLCLALLVGGAMLIGAVRARRAERRARAAARARIGKPRDPGAGLKEGAAVVLAGRLEASGGLAEAGAAALDTTYLAEVHGSEATHEGLAQVRAERLSIVAGGERIWITGPLEIVIGSRAPVILRSVKRAPAALAAALEPWTPYLGKLPVELRSIAPGDEVLVAGVLRREAAEGEDAYRAQALRWSLGAEAPHRVKIAFAGAPRRSVLRSAGETMLHAVVGALVFLAVFGIGGEIANERVYDLWFEEARAPGSVSPIAREVVTAAAITAVTPFRNEGTMQRLWLALGKHAGEDPAVLEVHAALEEIYVGCDSGAALWIEHGQIEKGAARAEACGAHEMAAHAWYTIGEFERASLAWERARGGPALESPIRGYGSEKKDDARFGARVHLLAGRLELAAAEARALAKVISGPWVSKGGVRHDERGGRALCLADALDARRGDVAARERLERAPPGTSYLACTILFADLLRGAERLAVVDARGTPVTDGEIPLRWLDLLAAEADFGKRRVRAAGGLDPSGKSVRSPEAALRDSVPALEGNAAPDGPVSWFLSLLSGSTSSGHPDRALGAEDLFRLTNRPWAERRTLEAAILGVEGDGARLADLLREDGHLFDGGGEGHQAQCRVLRLLAAGIHRGREASLHWIRGGRRPPAWRCSVTCHLLAWMDLAAAADDLGDSRLGIALERRGDWFHDALMRRDTAVPLAVLEAL